MAAPATPLSRETTANLARLEHTYLQRFGVYTRLHYQDRSFTNVEEMQYAAVVAGLLKERKVQPGDRVLLMLPNIPELTTALQAIWTIGAVAVPIMPQWTALEAGHVLRDSGAVAAVTVPPLAARLHEASKEAADLRHLLVFGASDAPGSENVVPQLRAVPPVTSPADRSASDLALLLYTSGTTGVPKGAMLTHGNVLAALDSAFRQNPDMARGPILQVLPFSHSFGLLMLHMANRSGFTNILMPQFDPVKVFQAIEHYQVQYMPAVPTMLVYLLYHPERGQYNLSSLRRIISGGAALPERVREACERAWGCRVEQGYGLSESFAVAAMYSESIAYRPGSAGPAVPGVQVRILGERNEVLPARAVGEICLSSPHVSQGYWNDAEATREANLGGWFRTGDVGYVDEEGFLFITDRKKDLIIKGGENISPREIEEVLYAHPGVAEAAVVGIPDATFGEEICAFVQMKSGMTSTEDEIRSHVGGFVTRFKVPVRVIFEQALPKNSIGKISKRDIRQRMANSGLF